MSTAKQNNEVEVKPLTLPIILLQCCLSIHLVRSITLFALGGVALN